MRMREREREIVCVCEKDLTCFLKEILLAVRLINGECLVRNPIFRNNQIYHIDFWLLNSYMV